MNVQTAIENHLRNVEQRYGSSMAELAIVLDKSGLTKFGEKREFLKTELGMSHGDANAVVNHLVGNKDTVVPNDAVSEIYSGSKSALQPLHECMMQAIHALGEFEIAPKKGYLSLRRKKQFAMIGPATKTQIEVGLNVKGITGTDRLVEQPAGGMCQYKVRIASESEVDEELLGWIRAAFISAG